MPAVLAFLVLALLSADPADAQSRLIPSVLEGAWERVEQIRTDMTRFSAQPGLRIFSGGRYSWVAIFGEEPRPPLPDSNGTAAELMAVWGDAFHAEAGTFELVSGTITQHPIVAKNPEEMDPSWYVTLSYRLVGDTLYLAQLENPTGPLHGRQPTGKYVRVR